MAANSLSRNIAFQIYNGDGTPFEGLILHKSVVDSVVMSLGDNITGDVYYKNNALNVTMNEYIEYKGVKYVLVNPPTILREGMVKDNGELKGMTKCSFTFYHPMYQLGNMPFCDVAVSSDQQRYLSENKVFSWIGYPDDYIAKLNKNLDGTEWIVEKSNRFPALKNNVLSEVLSFENNTIADALKKFYDTWEVPYVVDVVSSGESSYAQGKRFKVVVGLPSNEIYASESDKQLMQPYVFRMGQGVGLKNNSRTPRNNKIITRISGYGSEDNIPYGYPQIVWDGAEDDPRLRYPLYDGIVGGRYVKLIKHPFTRTHLMPSIYSETVNKKVNPNAVGYDPTIELKDYYDAIRTEEYPYVNEINPLAPSYESHEFDVKPEMNDGQSNVEILDAIPLNADLTPAESWDDTMDGDGKYIQSYFQITLPVLSFDLYACAAITQEMSINMRGGDCIGCTFPVQVNWDDYKANFYDQDGNFAPDGEQRDLTKYPKSNVESISVVVQKEYQTFGTIMPNVFQQPKNGDEFVVLGISLPSEYISNAEERLDREMKSYMLENNIYYFDYPLKFDEYFLATHTYILEQLKPNSVVRFDFAGNELHLFVKQLTIKYGENVLPQYDITLTDNVEVVLNQIGQVAEDVERLSSVISILRESYGRNVWTELSKKLSKVNDDTAQGFIRFIKGLQVGERFVTGLLGEGAVFRKEADGTTYLEADKMYIRMKAYFDTVEIRKYLHSAGNRVASVAGAKCIRVEYIDADGNVTSDADNAVVFRCYFRGSDGDDEVTNDFLVGDQVYCHITNGSTQSLQMHHYWRLLVGRNAEGELTEDGDHWIDLSNRPTETVTIDGSTYTHAGYQTGSDIPVAQDDMVQLGNINDTTRQGAIIEYVSGADSPSYQIYQGINDFSLNGKNQLALGYNTQTGRAYLNVYGDAYIGDPNGTSYIRYNTATKKMEIKAEVNIQSTFDGKTLPDYIAEHSSDWTEEEITALFTDDFNNIDAEIKNIQKQVDGSIETWFYNGVPSSSVLPESEWKAKDIAAGNNNERLKHIGDLYYDNQSGYAYRYTNQGTESVPQFVWTQISDSAVIKALENAAKAQDTADHKRRVFVRQPLDSEDYDVGDLWVNATYPSGNTQTDDANGRYYNDILKCIKHKDKNVAFSISDWGLSSKYTDDSALEQFKLNSYVQQLTGGELSQDIADAKQAADDAQADADAAAAAAANAKTAADNAQADAAAANNRLNGWANDGSISPTEKTSLKLEWENVKKEYTQICNDADKYGVSKTAFANAYTSANSAFSKYTAATPENITIGSDYDNIAAYYQARQTILDAITQAAKKVATDAATAAANAQAKADSAYTLAGQANAHAALFDSIRTALNQGTLIDGGLVLSTLIGLRDGDNKLWSGISGSYNTDLFGGGLAAWYGGGLADAEHKSQYPSGSDWAKSAFRFDGSGYLAGGNITWDKDGIVTIANVYSDVSGTKVPLSGTSLQYLNNIVNLLPTTLINGVNYIDPKTSFTTINALNDIKINGKQVATQEYVSQNYLSIAFFKRLFQAHNGSANVNPNDTSTTITDIEAMFGFWTNQYISALGKGSGGSGGGGGGASVLYGLNDVTPNTTGDGVMGAQDGYVLTYNGTTNHWYAAATAETYVLPQATADALGGIKIGYATSGKNYAIALDTNGKAYVNVPWTDHHAWGDISNKPTTISGYGITDAYTKTQVDSLVRLKSVALASDGVLAFTLQDGSVSYVDLTHQHDFQEILDKPTTLAGFGITDAKIESGVITLGGNTITPVTSVAMTVPTGFSISGTPISKTGTLALSYSSGYEGFTTDLKNMITALYSWFEVDSNGDIKTKDYTINGTTKHRGFWSPSFISALGQGSDSGGGGTGDVTWELLKSQATNDRYIHLSYISTALASYLAANNYIQSSAISDMATKTWVGNQGYLTQQSLSNYYTKSQVDALARLTNVAYSSDCILAFTHQDGSTTYADFTHEHSFLELMDKPTTIAGYEISDAYINNGVVYLGDKSITPVTSVAMTVPTGFSISGSPISKTGTLAVSYASGYEGFTTSLKEKIDALFSWFELDSDGNVKTKDYYDNGTTKHRGFWSESFISALGEGNDGGGGGQGDVTWELLKQADTRPINISHLTGALSGYATQSWVTSQGYVTTSGMNTAINALTYLNSVSLNKDGSVVFGGHGIENTILDLSHQHSFQELIDRPTTVAGYGITDMSSQSVNYATSAGSVAWANVSSRPTKLSQFTNDSGYITSSASITGNAGSATKLQTPRTIWGQSFDGSGNVSGAIYLNENVPHYFRDPTSTSRRSGLYYGTAGNEAMCFVASGANTKFLFVNNSDIADWDRTTHQSVLPLLSIGTNVGVGVLSPTHKLQVDGTFYASGNSSIGGTLGVSGATTLSSTLGVTGNTTLSGTLSVSKATTLSSTLGVTGATTLSSTLGVTGNTSLSGTLSVANETTLSSTLSVTGDTTLNGNVSIANGKRIYFKNTSGSGVSALLIDTSNNFVIGEGMSSYNTYLRGSGLTFQTGSSHTDRMTIDANGRVYVVNGSQGLRIGDALLTWESKNNAIKVSAVNGSGQVSFYATGGVSALGVGGSGSSGGGIDADWLKNNDVQIKRLGIGIAPSSSYQLNVQGASNFTGAVSINSALTVNSSVSAVGGFSTLQGSISAAHDITAGGNGLVYNRLTVGKTSVDTSYIFFVNGSAYVSNGIYLAGDVHIKYSAPASGVKLCNITAPSGLTVNGSTSWSSDMRKKNVVSYVNDLDVNKVAKAPVFRFTWKDKRDSVVRVGSSAQYWQNALANSVMDMGEYGLMLDYNAITIASAVVTARKVVDHELHIKQLEERVLELECEIKQLKAA